MLIKDFIEMVYRNNAVISSKIKERFSISQGDFTIEATSYGVYLGDARNFNKRKESCQLIYMEDTFKKFVENINNNHPDLTVQQLFDGEVEIKDLNIEVVQSNHHMLFTEDKLASFGKLTTTGINKIQGVNNKIDKPTLLKLLASGRVSRILQSYSHSDDFLHDVCNSLDEGREISNQQIVEDILKKTSTSAHVLKFDNNDGKGVIKFSTHSNNALVIHYSLAS